MEKDIKTEKIKKSFELTKKALEIAEKKVLKKTEGEKIIEMVKAYLEDSQYFLKKGDLVNSFGAIYYAHGWLDCGARLGIFDVKDDNLFTIN